MVDSNNNSLRNYLTKALQISAHPVRRNIIKELRKGGSLSASQLSVVLEEKYKLKVDRYNLYHHIEKLSTNGLIVLDEEETKGQIKYYKAQFIKNPLMLAYSYDQQEIKEQKILIDKILDTIDDIEGFKIEKRDKISLIEINITYNYNQRR